MAKNSSDVEVVETQEVPEAVTVRVTETPVESAPELRPDTVSEMEAGKAALARYQKA